MKTMKSLSLVLLLAGAAVSSSIETARAEAPVGPCVRSSAEGAIVCGSGPRALRVIEGTMSADGVYAAAWRRPSGDPLGNDEAQNYAVRLSDGTVLGQLVGDYWTYQDSEANHNGESVAWAPNGTGLIETVDGKWLVRAMKYYQIEGGVKISASVDLLTLLGAEARKALEHQATDVSADDYVLASGNAAGIFLTGNGSAFFSMRLISPRDDDAPEFAINVIMHLGNDEQPQVAATSLRRQ